MDYIQQIIQNLQQQSQRNNVESLIDIQVRQSEKEFAEEITSRWLTGKTPSGGEIGIYTNPSYKRRKQFQNPLAGGAVDLTKSRLMGQELVLNEYANLKYAFGSQVIYFDYVVKRYGLEQFNISEAQKQAFLDRTYNIVLREILEKVYG